MKEDEMGRHVVLMVEMRSVHNVSVGKSESKRPLGRL
jgi:hypothetical protein